MVTVGNGISTRGPWAQRLARVRKEEREVVEGTSQAPREEKARGSYWVERSSSPRSLSPSLGKNLILGPLPRVQSN